MNSSLINKIRQSVTNKEYKIFQNSKNIHKKRVCKNSPLCFEEADQLFPKDTHLIFRSENIFSNLKVDHFKPFKTFKENLFTQRDGNRNLFMSIDENALQNSDLGA